jgi:hypothetical protein
MYLLLFIAALILNFLPTAAVAGGAPLVSFVDGTWKGGIGNSHNSQDDRECWASTTQPDNTVFTLAKHTNEHWYLRFSNPSWQLPALHQYNIVALIDFYPTLDIVAVANNKAVLEIANIEEISLLERIENGHTITLTSDGFNAKYTLEGSAKIIGRLRNCSTD